MYEIKKLNEKDKSLLEKFCEGAEKAGYENNATIRKMKFGFNNVYDLGVPTHYWAILNNNKIISVSGCHLWSDDSKEYTINRVLFRSANKPLSITDIREAIPELKPSQISMTLCYFMRQRYMTREQIANEQSVGRKKVWLYTFYQIKLPASVV
jgi:hypothetical protein